jgi:hypothetical protein
VSEVGAAGLQIGSRHGFINIAVAAGWLVVCYLTLSLGWRTRITSRLLLAFAVKLIFAFLPVVISPRALGMAHNYSVYIMLIQVWLSVIIFPIGYAAFLLYVVLCGLGIERNP